MERQTLAMVLSVSIFFATTLCRDIIFPNVDGAQYALSSSDGLDDIDITGSKFHGLATFANLPYVDVRIILEIDFILHFANACMVRVHDTAVAICN